MSFGWSAGDILVAAQLLWKLFKALDEANGAPEHYRGSASMLRSIQFRLRSLANVVGDGKNPDPLSETEEASLLETADKDDIRYVVVRLKLAVEKLEVLVAKGCGLDKDPKKKKRLREWPMQQIRKLLWYIGKEDEINGLIQHIMELTAPLSDLYHGVSTVLVKQQALTQGVYHETQLKYLKLILDKVTLMGKGSTEGQLLDMNEGEKKKNAQAPLLHAGPDLGVLSIADPDLLDRGSALSHLTSVSHEIMSIGSQTTTKNLRADHYVKYKFTEWFNGTTSSRLWLYGDQVGTVSAIVYSAALDRRRPVIAFAGRHVAAGLLLTDQDRLFRMVYSLLFQLLLQFEDLSSFAITGIDKPFADLGLSMESMPLALEYVRYFLGLLPECVCIVDGWNFIANDAGKAVGGVLRDFLDLFGKPQAEAADDDWGIRLLVTSPGNSNMLRDLDREYVDSFDLKNHVGVGAMKLHTTLLGIDW